MKRIFFTAALLVSTSAFATMTVDELIKNYELSNIYEVDWYTKGEFKVAESSDKHRDAKISLSEKKGSALITLKGKGYELTPLLTCFRLTNLVPHKASNWGEPDTEDQKVLYKVFDEKAKIGTKNEAVLNGWLLKYEKLPNGATCSVTKQ